MESTAQMGVNGEKLLQLEYTVHFMLMGDCNYRFLSWPPYEDNNDISRAAGEFSECLDDNFFTQHVTIPTRNYYFGSCDH